MRALPVALLVAACQPQARRALLLDLTMADPVVVSGTAEPWHDAGYTVEYRQFYPHLARRDLERYHTVIFLLGREPEGPSDALTAGDLAVLDEWMRRGGVAVLGYDTGGEGSLDRWTANRWLAFEGAGIAVGDELLADTTARAARGGGGGGAGGAGGVGGAGGARAAPTTRGPLEPWAEALPVGDEPLGSVYEPFPVDRNDAIAVRDRSSLLAVSAGPAFIEGARAASVTDGAGGAGGRAPRSRTGIAAASRVGDGLVIVISRLALGVLGPQFRPATTPLLEQDALARTRDFLTALARWTRRPAEWAHVPPVVRGTALALAAAPLAVELAPPPLVPPDTGLTGLPLVPERPLAHATSVPDWLRQQGMRVLWAPLLASRGTEQVPRSSGALDSVVTLLDAGGFNLLAGDADPQGADSVHARWEERDAVRRAWADAVARLQPTSVAWIPTYAAAAARWAPGDSARGPRGTGLAAPCALDSTLWAASLAPAYAALGRLAAEQHSLVIALGLDLTGRRAAGLDFCDPAWHAGLARMGRGAALDALPYAARYPTLRDAGLLRYYYRALQDEVADRAATLRERVLRQRRDLYFAFRLPELPADWFTLALLRGFALPDRPMLVFTPEVRTRAALAAYRDRGLNLAHAVALAPEALRTRDWPGLRRLVFRENDGFWLTPPDERSGGPGPELRRVPADSLLRLIRRLVR